MKRDFGGIRVFTDPNVLRLFIEVHQTCDQRANACMYENALTVCYESETYSSIFLPD